MKITIVGASGLIGSRLVARLRALGHDTVAASPDTGVNTLTGEGLRHALHGASVVVDVSNSPSLEGPAALDFFETSTRNLLDAGARAGVRHHAALSIVGSDRLSGSGYYRAKVAQENLIVTSSVPYSIVHATQFFEFMSGIAQAATEDDVVRLPPVLVQPMAADDVAEVLARVALAAPRSGRLQAGGPERFRLDDVVRRVLQAARDQRQVIADAHATYFGAHLAEVDLVPGDDAEIGATRFDDWLSRSHGHLVRQG
jgi:uncharacterized protein YbjT (DUF2867 family)